MSGEQRRPTATLAEDERDELKRLRRSTLADLPMLFDEIGMGIAKLEAAGNSVNPERDCLRIVSEVRDRWLGAGRESDQTFPREVVVKLEDTLLAKDLKIAALVSAAQKVTGCCECADMNNLRALVEPTAWVTTDCAPPTTAVRVDGDAWDRAMGPPEEAKVEETETCDSCGYEIPGGHDPKCAYRTALADSSVDPDVERARNWLRSAKPHLYDLEGDEKDLDDDARQLAATLTYVRAEEREACALLFDYGPDGEAPGYDYLPECAAVIRARTAKAKAPKGERT